MWLSVTLPLNLFVFWSVDLMGGFAVFDILNKQMTTSGKSEWKMYTHTLQNVTSACLQKVLETRSLAANDCIAPWIYFCNKKGPQSAIQIQGGYKKTCAFPSWTHRLPRIFLKTCFNSFGSCFPSRKPMINIQHFVLLAFFVGALSRENHE